jgi:hypothetical protein
VADPDTPLALAADIERRDAEAAAALELVVDLGRHADEIRARSEELRLFLDTAPGELAALERSEAEARDAQVAAAATLADAEHRVAGLELARRSADAKADAKRELERAEQVAADASVRLRRVVAERAALAETEAAARTEGGDLVGQARQVALSIQNVPRVSRTGREAPGDALAGLSDWGGRVHAALFLVRGQLEAERDRLVREANELAGAVLGVQLAGSSVTLVRRRLEEALRR